MCGLCSVPRSLSLRVIIFWYSFFFFYVSVDLEDNDEDGEDDLEEALAEFEVCMAYDVFFFLFYLIQS